MTSKSKRIFQRVKQAQRQKMDEENQQNKRDQQIEHKQLFEERFQKLREEYSDDAFILVGPKNHFFQESLAIEFNAITINPKQEKHKFQCDFMLEQLKNYSEIVNIKRLLTIRNKQPKPVIFIDDSQSLSDKKKSSSNNKTGLLDLPTFQDDEVHYTPTFAAEYSKLSKNQYYNTFMNKVKDYRRQVSKDNIMEPRPRSKYMYCAICKDHYEEYLGHVNSKRHFQSYQRNRFARYITSLELTLNTGKFKKEKIIQEKRRATYQNKRKMKEGDSKKRKNTRQKCQNEDETPSQGSYDWEECQSKSKQIKIKDSQNSQEILQKNQQRSQKMRERTRDKNKLQKNKAKNDRKVKSKKGKSLEANQGASFFEIRKQQ